jgi:hypothetical protein
MHESFILQTYLSDLSLCDKLIEAHELSLYKEPGGVFHNGINIIDLALKDSEDSPVYGDTGEAYLKELKKVADEYIAVYPQSAVHNSWGIKSPPHVQKYRPGGGYFPWHCERSSGNGPDVVVSRHLVYMTYLNDVTDAGETEFQIQKLKVQPRKGLTLIWPAEWTHTHRGIASPTQEKYIATGWFCYF